MKNIVLSAVLLAMASCSNKQESAASVETQAAPTAVAPAPVSAHPGQILMEASDCMSCHKTEDKFIGPSYSEIAAKYTEADAEMLAGKIIHGGSGNWGEVMMTPHPNISEEEAKQMVQYILTLKK